MLLSCGIRNTTKLRKILSLSPSSLPPSLPPSYTYMYIPEAVSITAKTKPRPKRGEGETENVKEKWEEEMV